MTRPKNPIDRPFEQSKQAAEQLVRDGHVIIQKWTCIGCGARLCGAPQKWTDNGRCDEVDGKMGCGAVTDLRDRGCGYALITMASVEARAKFLKAFAPAPEGPQ